jgi:hypothetical protein
MGLVSLCGKGPEVVFAAQLARRGLKQIQVERTAERPFEAAAERGGSRIVQSNVILVATSQSRFPSMEAWLHRVDGLDPAVARKESVEGATEGVVSPVRRRVEADSLTLGVDARIGSPGGVGDGSVPEDALNYPLEFILYRAASRLALPPHKAGAVIV